MPLKDNRHWHMLNYVWHFIYQMQQGMGSVCLLKLYVRRFLFFLDFDRYWKNHLANIDTEYDRKQTYIGI